MDFDYKDMGGEPFVVDIEKITKANNQSFQNSFNTTGKPAYL